MNPFLRQPAAYQRTPLRAERPNPKTVADGVVTLRLYDPIDSWGGSWGVSAKEFVTVLDELPDSTTEIRLLINSPGGEVWEGLAVLNALRAHPARVVAVVEGIAASSASFIAAGVDELVVMDNAEIFIHKAWGLCIGNETDMRKLADDLAHEDRNLASVYAAKAGGTVEEWLDAMAAETFYSAEEAVAAGLADSVLKPSKAAGDAADQAKARFDLSMFARHDHPDRPGTGGPSDKAPSGAPNLPAAEPEPNTEPKEGGVSTLSTDVLARLGLPEDADDAAVMAAVDALKVKAEATQPTTEPDVDVEIEVTTPTAPQPTVPADPQPAAAVSAEYAAELQRLSAELAAIKAEKAADEKSALFTAAVRDGKIKPADRATWENRYDRAPDVIRDVLASIANGSAVPVQPAGYTGTGFEDSDADAAFDAALERLSGPVTNSRGV